MKKLSVLLGLLIATVASVFAIGCKDKSDEAVYVVRYTYGTEYAIEVKDGESYRIPELPTKDGYEFVGLYDAEVDGEKYVGADGNSIRPFSDGKDVTLYVRFVKVNTIKYMYGTEQTIAVREGENYEITSIPTKDGYEFVGLYDAEVDGEKYIGADGKSVRPFTDGEDVTLYVRFIKVNTIKYMYGTEQTIAVREGENYEISSIPTKDGYEFVGLYDAEVDGEKYIGADGKSVRPFTDGEDVTLYVRFVGREYEFEFYNVEGALSRDGARSAKSGETVDSFPRLEVGNHRVFGGWYTANNGGYLIADGSGRPTEKYKVFDHADYVQGSGYKVKLYAAVGYEKHTVKFYNEVNGEKTLLEERDVEYGTNIDEAAKNIKVGTLDVLYWTADGSSAATGIVTDDCELSVLCLGKIVELDSQTGTIVVSGNNANVMLCGHAETSYENLNISVGGGSASSARIILKDANIVGNADAGTVTSDCTRKIIIEAIGTKNSIGTSRNGAPAIDVGDNPLEIVCRAKLDVRGGAGKNSDGEEADGGNGGHGIRAASLTVIADGYVLGIAGGDGGNAYNRAIGDNGGDGYNGKAGYHGGNGGYGVDISDVMDVLSGEVRITGGRGGRGGDASECNRREFTKGEKDVVGGRGGNGGSGGAAVNAGALNFSSGVLIMRGGDGGNSGKAGGVHDNDTSGWNASVMGNTTASCGEYGTPGRGGKAVSDDTTTYDNISAASQTNGLDGEQTTEYNQC